MGRPRPAPDPEKADAHMRSHGFPYIRSMRGLFATALRRFGQLFAGPGPAPHRPRTGRAHLLPLARRYVATANPLGGEFLVNTFTANTQTYPVVAMDSAGAAVITWSSQNQDGNGWGVYA